MPLPTRPLLIALIVLAGGLVVPPGEVAHACGGFFPTVSDANLAIDAQRAVMVWRDREIELHLQLAADTDGADFAWIIPVPETPRLSLGDDAIFAAVDALSTPTVELLEPASGGGGGLCGASDSGAAGGRAVGGDGGVTHFGGGQLGDYAWDVIGGDDAQAIAAWLDSEGYATPGDLEALVAPYTSMRFLAVKLSPGAAADGVVDLQPLVLTLTRPGDTKFTYPLGFGRLSAADITPVLLYVLADKRYRVANAASTEVRQVAEELRRLVATGAEEPSYDDAVDSLTADAGGRLVITEYARDLRALDALPTALAERVTDEAFYLTRMYARVPRERLDDLVITFAHEAGDVDPDVVLTADAGGAGQPVSFALALTGLLIGVSTLRRRRSPGR